MSTGRYMFHNYVFLYLSDPNYLPISLKLVISKKDNVIPYVNFENIFSKEVSDYEPAEIALLHFLKTIKQKLLFIIIHVLKTTEQKIIIYY